MPVACAVAMSASPGRTSLSWTTRVGRVEAKNQSAATQTFAAALGSAYR